MNFLEVNHNTKGFTLFTNFTFSVVCIYVLCLQWFTKFHEMVRLQFEFCYVL
jgi:hypothetical protein